MSAPISCTKNVYFCFSPDCLRAKITETFGEICFISDTQYLTSFTVFSIGVLQMIIMFWKRNKKSSYDYFCSILELEQKIHIIKELDILIWLRDHSYITSSHFWDFWTFPPQRQHVFSTKNKQKLAFSDPPPPLQVLT